MARCASGGKGSPRRTWPDSSGCGSRRDQITPQMRILVATEAVDGRKGRTPTGAAAGGKLFGVSRIRPWGFRVFVCLCVSACWADGAVRKPLGVYVHFPVNDAIASYPGKAPSGPGLHT